MVLRAQEGSCGLLGIDMHSGGWVVGRAPLLALALALLLLLLSLLLLRLLPFSRTRCSPTRSLAHPCTPLTQQTATACGTSTAPLLASP